MKFLFRILLILGISLPSGCAKVDIPEGEPYGFIQIKGSDTMVNVMQALAEEFMKEYPYVFVAVTGGGSGTGIASLLNGTCELASCSRKMKKKEIDLAHKLGIYPKEHIVGYDGLAVIVHPSNSVSKLTVDQLADIFSGKIRNWKHFGGPDREIVILSREVNSGTHVYFKEHVLRKGNKKDKTEFAKNALLMPSSQAIADEVANNPSAIGYFGMGYLNEKVKAITVAKKEGEEYFLPTPENVLSGKYPVARPLFVYSNGEPQGIIKLFMDFVFSPKGQEQFVKTGFIPLKK